MAIIKDSTDLDNIQFLLDYCSKRPELYNEIAQHLYERFHMRSAEISLLVTYYVAEERRRSNGKKSTSDL